MFLCRALCFADDHKVTPFEVRSDHVGRHVVFVDSTMVLVTDVHVNFFIHVVYTLLNGVDSAGVLFDHAPDRVCHSCIFNC